jgi:hypothetical protein
MSCREVLDVVASVDEDGDGTSQFVEIDDCRVHAFVKAEAIGMEDMSPATDVVAFTRGKESNQFFSDR